MAAILLLGLLLVATSIDTTGAESVGVCYGMLGNNLPSHNDVLHLYKSRNIKRLRLYEPNHEVLQALRGSNIEVMLGIPNSDVKHIASSGEHARWWVEKNVRAFYPDVNITYIVVGNGISPFTDTSHLTSHLETAMSRIYNSVYFTGLGYNVNVTKSIDMPLMGKSYPPSQGSFRDDARKFVDPVVEFLRNTNAPLLLNVYPYFSYSSNPGRFLSPMLCLLHLMWWYKTVRINIGTYLMQWWILFMLPSDQIPGRPDQSSIRIVVSETGWPSAGGFGTTTDNAATYLRSLIQHAKTGTPRKPLPIETYLFTMFDENNKNPELEKYFGLFSPNKQPKYQLNFGTSDISAETNVTASSLIREM